MRPHHVIVAVVTILCGLAFSPSHATTIAAEDVLKISAISNPDQFNALVDGTQGALRDAIILGARTLGSTQVKVKAMQTPTSFDLDFEGSGFDAGVSVLVPLGSTPVREAEIRNGKVVITKKDNMSVVPVLQLHYFFQQEDKTRRYGQGPYIAVGLDKDKGLRSLGVGWMLGFRKSSESSQALSLGAGLYVAPNTTVLASDFKEGDAAPAGATKVETTEETVAGLTVTVALKY